MNVRSGKFIGRPFSVETTQRRFSLPFGKASGTNCPASISFLAIHLAAIATPMPSLASSLVASELPSSMKLFSRTPCFMKNSWISAKFRLLLWMSAFENVMLGANQIYFTASKAERCQMAECELSIVGIARAFALQPKRLLLDKPFGMLDSLTRYELQEVLLELWRRNRITTLMVTHDVDEAIFLSDRVVMMTDGPEAEVVDI